MPSKLINLIVFLFNFFAITNVKITAGKFKTSTLTLVKNFLILPIFFIFLNSSIPKSFSDASGTRIPHNSKSITKFFRLTFRFLMMEHRVAAAACVYSQIWNCRRIVKYLNFIANYTRRWNLNLKFFEKLALRKMKVPYGCLLISYVTIFLAIFSFTAHSVSKFFFFVIYGFIVFAFFSFIGLSLYFFQFCLQFVLDDLNCKQAEFKLKKTSNQLSDLFRLMAGFEEAFGFALSILAFFTMATVTIKVSIGKGSSDMKHLLFTGLHVCWILQGSLRDQLAIEARNFCYVHSNSILSQHFSADTMQCDPKAGELNVFNALAGLPWG